MNLFGNIFPHLSGEATDHTSKTTDLARVCGLEHLASHCKIPKTLCLLPLEKLLHVAEHLAGNNKGSEVPIAQRLILPVNQQYALPMQAYQLVWVVLLKGRVGNGVGCYGGLKGAALLQLGSQPCKMVCTLMRCQGWVARIH